MCDLHSYSVQGTISTGVVLGLLTQRGAACDQPFLRPHSLSLYWSRVLVTLVPSWVLGQFASLGHFGSEFLLCLPNPHPCLAELSRTEELDTGQPGSEGMSKITWQNGSLGEIWAPACLIVVKSPQDLAVLIFRHRTYSIMASYHIHVIY